jgi:hypothetical protein
VLCMLHTVLCLLIAAGKAHQPHSIACFLHTKAFVPAVNMTDPAICASPHHMPVYTFHDLCWQCCCLSAFLPCCLARLSTCNNGTPVPPSMCCAHSMYCNMCCMQVRVVVPGVFAAAIALSSPGSLQPLRVCVDSADRASLLDPWTHSRHQVGVLMYLAVLLWTLSWAVPPLLWRTCQHASRPLMPLNWLTPGSEPLLDTVQG